MKKIFKWICIIILILICIPVVVSHYLNQDHFKRLIIGQFNDLTDRELVLVGDLGMELGIIPQLYLNDVRLANASWSDKPWAAKIERVSLSLVLSDLIFGQISIKDIQFISPTLWIERNQAGQYNLDIFDDHEDQRSKLPNWLAIQMADIYAGRIEYAQSQTPLQFNEINAHFELGGRGDPINLELEMLFQNTKVNGKGRLPDLYTLFEHEPGEVEFIGFIHSERNRVSVNGTVDDLLSWEGLDLELESKIARLDQLSEVIGLELPNLGVVSTTGHWIQPGQSDTASMVDIKSEFMKWGLPVEVKGSIDQLFQMGGLDFEIMAAANYDLSPFIKTNSELVPLDINVNAEFAGSLKSNQLRLTHSMANGFESTLKASGSIKDIHNSNWGPIIVEFESSNPELLAEVMSYQWPYWSTVTATAELKKQNGDYQLSNLLLQSFHAETADIADLNGPSVNITGEISDLIKLKGIDLTLSATSRDLGFLSLSNDNLLSNLTNLDLESTFRQHEGGFDFVLNDFSGEFAGIPITGNGRIGDLFSMDDVEIHIMGQADSLTPIEPFIDTSLPSVGPIDFSANLMGAGNQFSLEGISILHQGEAIQFEAAGSLEDMTGDFNALMDFSLNLDHISSLSWPNPEMRSESEVESYLSKNKLLTNLSISGQLVKTKSTDWQLENISATSHQGQGFIQLQEGRYHFADQKLNGTISAEHYNINLYDWIELDNKDKFILKLDGSAIIEQDLNKSIGLKNIQVDASATGLKASLNGKVESLSRLNTAYVDLNIRADELHAIPGVSQDVFNSVDDVNADFSLRPGSENKIILDMSVGRSDLTGKIQWSSEVEKPVFHTKLHGNILDLKQLLRKSDNTNELFDETNLNFDWMRRINGTLELSSERFLSENLSANFLEFQAEIEDGVLTQQATAFLGEGVLAQKLNVDVNTAVPSVSLTFFGNELEIGRFDVFDDPNFINSGFADMDINIEGQGRSISSILQSSNGKVIFQIDDSHIKDKLLNRFGGDLFLNILSVINPFNKKKEVLDIECGVFNFDIVDGVAISDKGIAMQTPKVSILGGGEIDLGSEQLKLIIKPKARKGLGISATTVANLVRVTGPIVKPDIEAVPKSILQSGATIGAVVATGGWTLVAQGLLANGLITRSKANAGVCDIAINKVDKKVKQPTVER